MSLPEYATDAYINLVEKIGSPVDSRFFADNPQWRDLKAASADVLGFAIDRPAILINDATDKTRIMDLLGGRMGTDSADERDGEWREARDETLTPQFAEDAHKYLLELGDVGFFALLAGIVFWEDLDQSERDHVLDALVMADNEAAAYGSSLSELISSVATVKDTINYPVAFLQVSDVEKTADIPQRITDEGKLLRAIRHELNGTWKESQDLVTTLREHALAQDELAEKIVALFVLSSISINEDSLV